MNIKFSNMIWHRKLHLSLRLLLAVAMVYLGVFIAPAEAEREIKRPEDVFLYEARTEGNELIVNWKIEDGYYLYHDKMKFQADDLEFGDPIFPQGEIHSDEFFGEQLIYRGDITVHVPVTTAVTAENTVEVTLISQGCADFGLCYPPQKWQATVATPKLAKTSALPIVSNKVSNELSGLPFGKRLQQEPLRNEEAFIPSLTTSDPFTLEVRWDIAPGYYLYKKDFAVTGPDNIRTGVLQIPEGIIENDLEFGAVEVYFDSVVFSVPLSRTPAAESAEFELAYQGCKQDSICYPPAVARLSVELPEATAEQAAAATVTAPVSEQDRLFGVIKDGSLLTMMSVFLGLGLLLAFSPCCLPMVPILSGIIAGQGEHTTTSRSFLLSLAYVLGMAITYTIAGAIVGAAGGSISAALQTPLVISFVAILFVVLSLSMFGAYELQVPVAIQTRLTAAGSKGKAGSFAGTVFLGAISALVVSTCVAPPLVAALMVIAQTGDVARGAFALFSLSMGMGIPLLVFGASAGKLLPKAGPWMDNIKAVFGFMLLGLAVWMLDRILPAAITMALYASLAVFAGVRFGAFKSLPDRASATAMFGKAISMLLLLYGTALGVGALSGSSNPLQPLDKVSGASADQNHLEFATIKSLADFESARDRAAANNQPLMLDFYADWCVSCKEMEAWTFTDAKVQAALANTVLIQADVTANDKIDQELLKHFGIFGPPTIVFYNRSGEEIKGQRVIGYMPTADFLRHLDYVLRQKNAKDADSVLLPHEPI